MESSAHRTDRAAAQRDARRRRQRARLRAGLVSLGVGSVLFALKFLAYLRTDSAAILSDALESTVNIAAAALASFSVWMAAKPADRNHPYGHGKAEDFSAGIEGALIVLAAGAIFWSAVPRFFAPRALQEAATGATLVAVAAIANLLLGLYLMRQGRIQQSRALDADGRHILADVATSGGALAALVLVEMTGRLWIDPLVACLIAIHVLVSGYRLIRESVGRLMDEADEDSLAQLATVLERRRRLTWVDVHNLRAWRAGDVLNVDCHLMLPRYWSIEKAHAEADHLVEQIRDRLGIQSDVVVHTDPCRDEFCRSCEVSDCSIRTEPFRTRLPWDRQQITRDVE